MDLFLYHTEWLTQCCFPGSSPGILLEWSTVAPSRCCCFCGVAGVVSLHGLQFRAQKAADIANTLRSPAQNLWSLTFPGTVSYSTPSPAQCRDKWKMAPTHKEKDKAFDDFYLISLLDHSWFEKWNKKSLASSLGLRWGIPMNQCIIWVPLQHPEEHKDFDFSCRHFSDSLAWGWHHLLRVTHQ